MATTLLQFAQDLDAARLQALQQAQQVFTLATAADRAAEDQRLAAVAAAAAAAVEVEAVRRALALAQTPAQVAALSEELKDRTVAQRAAADASAAQELVRAQAAAALQMARLAAEFAALAQDAAAQSLEKAIAEDTRRQDIITRALVQAPLLDVVADATAILASPEFAAAQARIDNALPAALAIRARERTGQAYAAADRWLARLQGAQAAYDGEFEASGLDSDTLARLQRDFAATDTALTAYAGQAAARLASATATLKRLSELTVPPLTPEQKASLDDLQGTDRPDAADAQKARDDAALALTDKAALYAAERIKALATDPQGDIGAMEADAAAFPDLRQAKTAFDDAQTVYDQAELAFTDAHASLLAEWQAEVPDTLWSEAASLYAAQDALVDLTVAPAALVTALQAAETALVAALEGTAERQRRIEYVSAALAAQQSLAGAVAKRVGERSTNALRGALVIEPLLQP